jgi:hypothetical protein
LRVPITTATGPDPVRPARPSGNRNRRMNSHATWTKARGLETCLISAVVLLIALGQHPYACYQMLRWVVCVSALIVAWVGYRIAQSGDQSGWVTAGVFVVLAVLFNPLAPITQTRSFWQPWDVLAAALFALAFMLKLPGQQPNS